MENKAICELAENLGSNAIKGKTDTEKVYVDDRSIIAIKTSDQQFIQMLDGYEIAKNNSPTTESLNQLKWDSVVQINPQNLKLLLKFITKCKDIDRIKIHVSPDYPIKFELVGQNTDFIVAPRVDE